MKTTTLSAVAESMEGRLLQGDAGLSVQRLHTDSRTVAPGDCFVALVGERFDGHEFLSAVAKAGAVAAVVSRLAEALPPLPAGFGLIYVEDTLLGLQKFSTVYRRSHDVRVVAVTGSSGKTSTKEMIAAVLGRRFRTLATEGNLNNHLGVPFTLLRIEPETEYAVVEMGMNHRGEIAALAKIAEPHIAVITGIGSAHIEHLGSRQEIAEEKTDLMAALPADGAAIINADDPFLRERAFRVPAGVKVVWAGFAPDAEWRAENVSVTPQGILFDLCHKEGSRPIRLPLFNRVMVSNALLAAAVGGLAGLPLSEIAAALEEVRLVGGRMRVVPRRGGWVIDDCYNANPESARAALAALREFPAPARRVAVVGSMGELGGHAPALHRELGRDAATSGAGLLAFVGPHAGDLVAGALEAGFPAGAILRFTTTSKAVAALPALVLVDDTVLVKGSRFLKLEQVIAVLVPQIAVSATSLFH